MASVGTCPVNLVVVSNISRSVHGYPPTTGGYNSYDITIEASSKQWFFAG